MTETLPINLPKVGDTKLRFTIYKSPRFTVYGDLYSEKRLFLHLKLPIKKMTPSLMKEMISLIARIKTALHNIGYERFYTLVPESLVKFENVFGFHVENAYITQLTDEVETTLFLMSQETC